MRKNNIRKIIALSSALTLTASVFTACGGAMESNEPYYTQGATYADNAKQLEANDERNYYAEITAVQNIYADVEEAEEGVIYEEDYGYEMPNTEEYNHLEENGFQAVSRKPLSTFSADVDTASYANLRRMIYNGWDVDPDAVRIEEMINYFDYDYADPKEGEPFAVYTEYADCPWNSETKLFMAGLSTKSLDSQLSDREPMNLVFLIDVSGSMYSDDKLPLVQKSFSLLTDNLSDADRISIVTYAGEDAVLLEGADGGDRDKVLEIIDSLEAGGSTAGAAGIVTAYRLAEKYFIDGGNNRVILATDGDLNVGLSTEEELTELIEEKRESGVFLSVLGFGTGNYKDNRLEALADHGNGNYSYIDSAREAKKVLVDEMSGTLYTAAKDVKFQIEFNPAEVKGYRLIGYENRKMADRDFADDTKDAGEVGAGHSVTVLYEIIPADSDIDMGDVELKYSEKEETESSGDLLTVSIRYKAPDGDTSTLLEYPIAAQTYKAEMSERMNFAAAVTEFGMLLRGSRYAGEIGYEDIIKLFHKYDYSGDEYKNEFYDMVETVEERS